MQETSRRPAKVLAVILCVLVVLLLICGVFIWLGVSKIWEKPEVGPIEVEEFEPDPEASGLPEVSYKGGEAPEIGKSEGITDILLIGVDNRHIGKFSGLSDVMIYLRIDTNSNSLKLASFMRDTLVPIEGHSRNKLNAAFSFGGIDLTKKTFKANFGLEPDHYIVVNFYGMEDIINGLGGVNIDIKSNELPSMNASITEINNIDKRKSSDTLQSDGRQRLDGRQAVAYMRIRNPGGDAGRIERQQTVLSALFRKAKDIGLGQIPGLAGAMINYVRTDMPLDKMIDIAGTIKGMENEELKKFRYPLEFEPGSYKKMSVVQPKVFEDEIKKLHDFLNK